MSGETHFEVYPRRKHHADTTGNAAVAPLTGDYGWRFQDANGKISAVGGEGFTRREDAHRAARVVVATIIGVSTRGVVEAVDIPIVDVDE